MRSSLPSLEAVAVAIRAALNQATRAMATAETDTEAGEITLQSLQLYHHKDGTPYTLGAGTFGRVRLCTSCSFTLNTCILIHCLSVQLICTQQLAGTIELTSPPPPSHPAALS